jgi:hypothetical protein
MKFFPYLKNDGRRLKSFHSLICVRKEAELLTA